MTWNSLKFINMSWLEGLRIDNCQGISEEDLFNLNLLVKVRS